MRSPEEPSDFIDPADPHPSGRRTGFHPDTCRDAGTDALLAAAQRRTSRRELYETAAIERVLDQHPPPPEDAPEAERRAWRQACTSYRDALLAAWMDPTHSPDLGLRHARSSPSVVAIRNTVTSRRKASGGPPVGTQVDLVALFAAADWRGPQVSPTRWTVRCPSECLHASGERYDGTTLVVASADDGGLGEFRCVHPSCSDVYTDWTVVVRAVVALTGVALAETTTREPGTEG